MAFQPVDETVNLIPYWTLPNGQIANNVLAFRYQEGAPDTFGMQALIDEFVDWHAEIADLLQSAACSLTRVVCRSLHTETAPVIDHEVTPAQLGTNGAAVMPSNVSCCTKFGTGRTGRSQRGRAYWVGLSETMVANDYVVTGVAEGIRQAWATLGAAADAISWDHVVISRYNAGVLRPVGLTTVVTEYVTVTDRVASQRRRLPGIGG